MLVVDDHAMVREGLMRILEAAFAGWRIRGAGDAFAALEALHGDAADLALVDVAMPGMNGLELVRRIRAEAPHTRVLVLSMHAEEQYALRALRAGAQGYLTKDRAAEELVAAVDKVAAGGTYISASLAERVVQEINRERPASRHAELTDREFDVFRRITAGQRLAAIAAELKLSIKTVSTHKRRVLEKLGLASTAALIRYGIEQQLEPGPLPPAPAPGTGPGRTPSC